MRLKPLLLVVLEALRLTSVLGQLSLPGVQLYHNRTDPFFQPFPIAVAEARSLPWSDVREAIQDAQEEMCGTTRLCEPRSSERNRADSCSKCDTCFCDHACHAYGDCCLDKIIDDVLLDTSVHETQPVRGTKISDCTDVRAKGHKYTSNDPLNRQRVITKCPESFQDAAVRSACEDSGPINQRVTSLDITPEQLSTNWPVASRKTSLYYKNSACAKCHADDQEESLVFWKMRLSYDVIPGLPPSADPHTVLQAFLKDPGTEVAFSVPDGMQPRKCQFLLELELTPTDQCNTTGERSMYDPVLWKSCEVFTNYAKIYRGFYANLFCYLCQMDERPFVTGMCAAGTFFPFFVVLSPDALESVQNARQSFDCRCRRGFLYDPYKDNCRRLHCATGRKLGVELECISTVDVSKGQEYSVSFTMTSQWPTSSTTGSIYPQDGTTFHQIAEHVRSEFTTALFNNSFAVDFENFLVNIPAVTRDLRELRINVYAEMSVRSEVSQAQLESRLLSLHGDVWHLQLPGLAGEITLTSTIIQTPEIDLIIGIPRHSVLQRPIEDGSSNATAARQEYLYAFDRDRILQRRPQIAPLAAAPIVRPYAQVKNTLMCPHFIYDLTNTTEVKIKDRRNNSHWPYSEEILVHVPTGVELSTLDFARAEGGLVIVCVEEIREKMKSVHDEEHHEGIDAVDVFGSGLVVTSHVCLSISAVCLALTLVTYCLFPSLRTLPGKSTMCLVGALLLAIVLFFAGGFVQESSVECQVIGVLTHFFLLSAFVWMLMCTVHMYSVFSNVLKHTPAGESDDNRRLVLYTVISVIVPGVIVTSTILANYSLTPSADSAESPDDNQMNQTASYNEIEPVFYSCQTDSDVRIGYGAGICYLSNKLSLLLAAALPIAVLCAANLVMFILTLVAFRTLSMQEKVARREERGHVLIYIKLSTLTGINWLPCTVAAFVSSALVWYAFLILCGLQGLYVFISFVCNKRVLGLYRQGLRESMTGSSTSGGQQNRRAKYVDSGGTARPGDKRFISNTLSTTNSGASTPRSERSISPSGVKRV